MSMYPAITDWEFVNEQQPRPLLGPSSRPFVLGLLRACEDIDLSYQGLASQVADPSVANEQVLARMAQRYRVSLAGLTLGEQRRLVLAAKLARRSRGVPADVWAVWLALTGARAEDAAMRTEGAASVHLRATVTDPPRELFLRRAATVVRQAIGAGYEAMCLIGVGSTARYDAGRYDAGRYGWSFSVVRS